jgi:hypothetical protein
MSAIEITRITAGIGLGGNCNYLYGKASGLLKGKEAKITLFAGEHVHIGYEGEDPPVAGSLQLLPEQTYKYIHAGAPLDRQVRGFYAHASLWFSINELFGIPDSCFFSAQAKLGQGFFGFTRPAWNVLPQGSTNIGAVLEAGVRARILCVADASGELLLVPQAIFPAPPSAGLISESAHSSNEYRVDGRLVLKGKVGYCPFCVEKSKTFEGQASYKDGEFTYHID